MAVTLRGSQASGAKAIDIEVALPFLRPGGSAKPTDAVN